MYRLLVYKQNGDITTHHFNSYDDMEYNGVLCAFSSNIFKTFGQKETLKGWETVITF